MSEYIIHIGEIVPQYQEHWTSTDNPFAITSNTIAEIPVSICDGMREARLYLHDEHAVDWGSWAWRGTKEEIENMVSATWPCKDISLEKLEDGKEYAFIYIEMY